MRRTQFILYFRLKDRLTPEELYQSPCGNFQITKALLPDTAENHTNSFVIPISIL